VAPYRGHDQADSAVTPCGVNERANTAAATHDFDRHTWRLYLALPKRHFLPRGIFLKLGTADLSVETAVKHRLHASGDKSPVPRHRVAIGPGLAQHDDDARADFHDGIENGEHRIDLLQFIDRNQDGLFHKFLLFVVSRQHEWQLTRSSEVWQSEKRKISVKVESCWHTTLTRHPVMSSDSQFVFPPYTLDVGNQSLRRAGEKISLRSKSFAVLSYLVEHPHQLVSKDELIQTAWAGAKVVDAALRVSIQDIRKALGDDSTNPKYIETAGKSGYRFIAPISLKLPLKTDGQASTAFVGRDDELEQLRQHLALANGGTRQIVFVTGEPGIGKTALVDAFIAGLSTSDPIVIAHGQCIEQYGAGEAYMPILDMLDRLCKLADGAAVIEALRRLAPSWLLSLPGLVSADESAELARQNFGVTPERRLREIAAFLEEIAKSRTVLLVVEDLHWLDPSTLALIAYLARRREATRLLLIGTCRPGELAQYNQPLKAVTAELSLHHLCAHLPLELLSNNAVGQYLAIRFNIETVPETVLSTVYCRSEGNPLFMVNITDYLVGRQTIVREKNTVTLAESRDPLRVPETIRELINRQFEALPDEDRELLETASVAGMTYSVALIALVMGKNREELEKRCRHLAERQQFLTYAGTRTRPGGTTSARFGFLHALYQNIIYDRLGDTTRRRLHQNIANVLHEAFHHATEQVAAELALHFDRAGDYQRATHYHIQAAQKATQQSAYQEAIIHATSGLRLLKSLPDNRQRIEMELNLQISLSVSLASTRGYAAAEVSEAYNRANLLCQKVKDESLRTHALIGLFTFYLMSGKPRRALDFGKQMIIAAQLIKDRASFADGQTCRGMAHFYLGEYSAAQDHFDQAHAAYGLGDGAPKTPDQPDYLAYLLTYTAVNLWFLGYNAINLWVLGYPERAEAQMSHVPFLMEQLSHPLSLVVNQIMLASFHQCRGDAYETLKLSDDGMKSAGEHGFHHWLAGATMCKGWALVNLGHADEGIALLREGLTNWRAIGTKTEAMRFITLLAEGCLLSNRTKEGLSLISEALKLIDETEDRFFQSEVFRIGGELLKKHKRGAGKHSDWTEAESHFLRAIDIARHQRAKSFELRATISLARLWQETGKGKEAKRTLAKIYGWFTEGFETPDLKAAKALLDELT
jgi:DNA-binding winged helix-turn-helix (wHTH) protein/tetratricopeptide (TPR) repeat protein